MERALERPVHSPIDGSVIGHVSEASEAHRFDRNASGANRFFATWSALPIDDPRRCCRTRKRQLESNRGPHPLLQIEGGKTLDDALAEVREAVDLCRYYAVEAKRTLSRRHCRVRLGKTNELRYRGRGLFVCISPWNFPLAIFLGQVRRAWWQGTQWSRNRRNRRR